MYMRLAFAVAAHLEPEVLVIDEVLAVGDAEFQKKCLGKMSDIAQSGRTVLFVSHNMNAIEELCTRVLLLNKGTVNQLSSDVRSVITHYLKSDDVNATQWINSGNEFPNPYFQPLSFKIVDKNGMDMPMPLRNDDDFYVQLEGKVEQLDPALTIGCAVYSETGELLFWSYQTDVAEENWPKLQEGVCILRGKLPAHLLNEGSYRLELTGGLHFRQWLFEPKVSAPSINIEIQGGLSTSPYWMSKRPGLLAPVLVWNIT
jgi:lipopolysaccharide transport system ATP-binding protein